MAIYTASVSNTSLGSATVGVIINDHMYNLAGQSVNDDGNVYDINEAIDSITSFFDSTEWLNIPQVYVHPAITTAYQTQLENSRALYNNINEFSTNLSTGQNISESTKLNGHTITTTYGNYVPSSGALSGYSLRRTVFEVDTSLYPSYNNGISPIWGIVLPSSVLNGNSIDYSKLPDTVCRWYVDLYYISNLGRISYRAQILKDVSTSNFTDKALGSLSVDELSTDPYDINGSGSGGGGGNGLDSVSGSDVSDPDLPELSAVSTGLVSIFSPTLAQLQALGSFLWSDLFSVDTFKKIFTDPWDAILGLSILGVGVSGGTLSAVNIGNVNTGVNMPKLSSQYYKFNCGSVKLKETWGSYLDYNPYTKVSIYLPFIGTHALNVDDIMGKTISLKYNIDILSGACVANIQCGGTVLYSFTGCCSATIPLSGSSYTNMINGILGVATSIGAAVATGGAAAPVTAATITGSVMSSLKTDVSRTGNVSGMAGIMGVKSAYLIMEVPRICIPKNQDKYIGYPTYVTKKVGDLSGYCVFEDIKVRGNSHATIGEIEEIEAIMKEGVYL